MYLRTIRRKNKDGSVVEYYQLAHNERHPDTHKPVAKVVHSFGRADELDRDELVRLCKSIARVCGVTVIDPFDDGSFVICPYDPSGETGIAGEGKLSTAETDVSFMFCCAMP